MKKESGRKITRRQFLKLLGIGVAAEVGKQVFENAKNTVEHGFITDGVRYYPMYEEHYLGPTVPLPKDADAIFVEYNLTLGNNAGDIYNTDFSFNNLQMSQEKQEILKQVVDRKLPVAFGDIGLLTTDEFNWVTYGGGDYESNLNKTSLASAITMIGAFLITKLDHNGKNALDKIDRRKVLRTFFDGSKITMLAAFSWSFLGSYTYIKTVGFGGDTPIERILYRLHGMLTNLHPDVTCIFMRNVIMALKLKLLGERLKSSKELPLIGFQLGRAHSGIEDLLHLDIDTLRNIFVSFDPDYIAAAVKKHGTNVAVVKFTQPDTSGVFITTEKIVDHKLIDMLGLIYVEEDSKIEFQINHNKNENKVFLEDGSTVIFLSSAAPIVKLNDGRKLFVELDSNLYISDYKLGKLRADKSMLNYYYSAVNLAINMLYAP